MTAFTFPGWSGSMAPIGGFYTPFSDLGPNIMNHQGTYCEQFELNFYRCVEAFGMTASKRKCDLEYRDLLECVYQRKQMGRYHAMRQERMKQFMEGKRDRPWGDSVHLYVGRPDWYEHRNFQPIRPFN